MSAHPPNPAKIFETLTGFQPAEALATAIDLDLFTAVAEGATTSAAIAAKCSASERGVRILADFLTVHGFLTKESGVYGLTPDTAFFLDSRKPSYLGRAKSFLMHEFQRHSFGHLTDAVKTGASSVDCMQPSHEVWTDFARGMMPMMMPNAHAICEFTGSDKAGPIKVLDLAAGHGVFGITVAQRNPEAQIYAVDWANVLDVAREHAQQFGVADRWHAIPGSAFDVDYGSGYDLALVTNFLHHFGWEQNVALMNRVKAALKPGGQAAILEFAVSEDRLSPPMAGTFAITMLANTKDGDAYSVTEIDGMCREAGFSSTVAHAMAPMPQTITVALA